VPATRFIGALHEIDCNSLAAGSYYAEFAPMGFTEFGSEKHEVTQTDRLLISLASTGLASSYSLSRMRIAVSLRRLCRRLHFH
jgi:hypothetical protein